MQFQVGNVILKKLIFLICINKTYFNLPTDFISITYGSNPYVTFPPHPAKVTYGLYIRNHHLSITYKKNSYVMWFYIRINIRM